MPPVPLSRYEWERISLDFPALIRESCHKTDKMKKRYNGMAWALGLTDTWIDPPRMFMQIAELCEHSASNMALCITCADSGRRIFQTPGLRTGRRRLQRAMVLGRGGF